MNKQGRVEFEILLMLITIVVTSAVLFTLVRAQVIEVKPQTEEVSVLNTEFLPYGREGVVVVKSFQFCGRVDEQFNCLNPKETFKRGEEVHFLFVVESTTVNGEIRLAENYRFGNAQKVFLNIDEKNTFNYELDSRKDTEEIKFKDYFIAGWDLTPGDYNVDLVMENTLLQKKATFSKKVSVE